MTRSNIKKKILLSAALLSIGCTGLSGFAVAEHHEETMSEEKNTSANEAKEIKTTVDLINIDGAKIGTVKLTDTPNGVLLLMDAENIPSGPHSFHIHETAACSTEGAFTSAGGHLNPDEKDHGFYVDNGPHAGDLPNIHVGEDGKIMTEVLNTRISLKEIDGRTNLLDEDGSAIMIHEMPDDYISQPTGGGGARIACAEIK